MHIRNPEESLVRRGRFYRMSDRNSDGRESGSSELCFTGRNVTAEAATLRMYCVRVWYFTLRSSPFSYCSQLDLSMAFPHENGLVIAVVQFCFSLVRRVETMAVACYATLSGRQWTLVVLRRLHTDQVSWKAREFVQPCDVQ
ncbi:hypothetical protein EVAR_75535_1 [Eumeta japonica]|uniref:Uncharacterized protein n=1 Tax=Eumeta variegata TaxID=151549 RepID=A0A4C1UIV0_EUMVA|nr:hypothetical protein EVAR_75535_1 [Eumeta japonica]